MATGDKLQQFRPTGVVAGDDASAIARAKESRDRDWANLREVLRVAGGEMAALDSRVTTLEDRAVTGEWDPIIYRAGAAVPNTYLQQEGIWQRVGDRITAQCWVRTNGAVNLAAQTVAIGDLPFIDDIATDLTFWPAIITQAALLAGGVFGKLQPANSLRVFVNDTATQLGQTAWTINVQLFFSMTVQYRIQ